MHDLDGLRQAWTAHERRAMARVGPCGTPTPAQADRPRPRRHRCNRVCPPRPKSPVSTHSYFEKPREYPPFPGHIGRGGCGALSPATVRHLGATVAPEGEPASLGPTPPPPRALIVDMRSSQVLLSERLQINDSAHLKYLETVRCTAHALLALADSIINARANHATASSLRPRGTL